MRFSKLLLVIAGLAAAGQAYAAVSGSIGFVQGNIWYSKDPFFAGNAVRIYSGVFNGGSDDIIGTVEFSDNGSVIGTSEFQAVGGGRLREVWIDWQATAGAHTITAKIARALVTRAGKPNEPAQIVNGDSGQSARDVDIDTDGDNTGNTTDTDDDNDGVSDVDELRRGTDPLLKDTDGDGLSDKTDPAPTVKGAAIQPVNSTQASSPVMDTANKAVASVTETIDTVADRIKNALEIKKRELEVKIAATEQAEAGVAQTKEGQVINDVAGENIAPATRTTSTPGDTVKRIALQLYRGAIIAALYILDHKILLYILLAFVLYKLIRFVFGRFFRRSI